MPDLKNKRKIILIGYSGHAFVVCDVLHASGNTIAGYMDFEEKKNNPFGLTYLGSDKEKDSLKLLQDYDYFVCVGSNKIRKNIYHAVKKETGLEPVNAIHNRAVVSTLAALQNGIMVSANAVINAGAKIGVGVICNTAAVIEHECTIGAFSHIAPNATLAGNVTVGKGSFIGANSVIKEGLVIGDKVIVGAGTVVLQDIPDGATVVGNPGRVIRTKKLKI